MAFTIVNSGHPYEMPLSVAFHLGLYYFPASIFRTFCKNGLNRSLRSSWMTLQRHVI